MRTLDIELSVTDKKKPSKETVVKIQTAIDTLVRESADDLEDAATKFLSVSAGKIMPPFYAHTFSRWDRQQQDAWTEALLRDKTLCENSSGWGSIRVKSMIIGKLSCNMSAQMLEPELHWMATHLCNNKDKSDFICIREQSYNFQVLFDIDVSNWGNEKKRLIALYGMMMENCENSVLQNAYQAFIARANGEFPPAAASVVGQTVAEPPTEEIMQQPDKAAPIDTVKVPVPQQTAPKADQQTASKKEEGTLTPYEAEADAKALVKWISSTNTAMFHLQESELNLRREVENTKKHGDMLTAQLDNANAELRRKACEIQSCEDRIHALEQQNIEVSQRLEQLNATLASVQRMEAINIRQAVNGLKTDVEKTLKVSSHDAEQITANEQDAFEIIRSILMDTIEEISKKCTREGE